MFKGWTMWDQILRTRSGLKLSDKWCHRLISLQGTMLLISSPSRRWWTAETHPMTSLRKSSWKSFRHREGVFSSNFSIRFKKLPNILGDKNGPFSGKLVLPCPRRQHIRPSVGGIFSILKGGIIYAGAPTFFLKVAETMPLKEKGRAGGSAQSPPIHGRHHLYVSQQQQQHPNKTLPKIWQSTITNYHFTTIA